MKTETRNNIVATPIAWLAVLCIHVHSGNAADSITTFTSRASWNTAVGGSPSFLADFNSIVVGTDFRATPVDVGPFSLQVQGTPLSCCNLIDLPPYVDSDPVLDGTPLVFAFVDGGNNPATTVVMRFATPIHAWAADFFAAGNGSPLTLDLATGTGTTSLAVPGPGNAQVFFGFLDPNEAITQITFRNTINDGFYFDNVAGVTVPEPSTFALLATGLGLLLPRLRWRRHRKNAIEKHGA